jgi:TonB family protein
MKTQLGGGRAPLACHWRAHNVLRERIATLALPSIAVSRRRLGGFVVAAVVLAAGAAAWAAQPTRTHVHYTQIGETAAAPIVSSGGEETTGLLAESQTEPASALQRVPEQRVASVSETFASHIEVERQKPSGPPVSNRNSTSAPARPAEPQLTPMRAQIDAALQPSTTPHAVTPESDGMRDDGAKANPDSAPYEIASFRREHAPTYPAAAVRTHLEGTVMLDVHVDADGRPLDARVARLTPEAATELASASLAAVTHWRFEPARRGGLAVDSHLNVPFVFALDGQASYAAPEAHRQASYRTVGAPGATPDVAATDAVVYVRVRIEDDGNVSASSVDHIDPASATNLGDAALAALKTWTFNPARDRDKAVASTAIVPVVFGSNPRATPAIARLRNLLDPIRVTLTRN